MSKKDLNLIESIMSYNENGEGVINGKTIRELEAESMAQYLKNHKKTPKSAFPRAKKVRLHKRFKDKFRKNTEIIIGVIISIIFMLSFYLLKTGNQSIDYGFLGGLFGGLGTIIAILLSISFSRRSNEQTLDSAVLPYIIVKKLKEPPADYFAYEFFTADNSTFSGWRNFDFTTIKENKRTLVRNGIAYLHLKNIGLGSAKNLRIYIDNFSSIFLDKDYLLPNESMYLILNFNNPDNSIGTNLVFEYDTIRDIHHSQEFHANITRHLDRTNFTLFD